LEEMTGKTLEHLARDMIFDPLGMGSSTFEYPLPPSWRSREAMPHNSKGIEQAVSQDIPGRAQGGLLTTTIDMSRLIVEVMNAYQGKSTRILSRELAQAMMTPQVEIPPDALGGIEQLKMGLGVILTMRGGELSFLHPGHSSPGSTFLVVAFPDRGAGVVVGTNGNQGGQLELEILATLAEIYGWPSGQYYKRAEK
jgi:CubicO group peptidase (beta-lactamase class C family)